MFCLRTVGIFLLFLMKTSLCDGSDCPEGWIVYGNSCYYFSDDSLNWDQAFERCKSLSSHLVEIENLEENNFLTSVIISKNYNDYYIGISDIETEGVWKWMTSGRSLNFSNWRPGEPNNCCGGEHCGQFYISPGTWNDAVCSNLNRYICEMQSLESCLSNPCNNGTCEDTFNGYLCACAVGFIGENCETDLDECISNPCENGGTCIDGINGYSCTCKEGHSGNVCEDDGTCASKSILNVPDMTSRGLDDVWDGEITSVVDDSTLEYRWYHALQNGWQYLMVDSSQKPSYNKCGTNEPIYLQEVHPSLESLNETEVSAVACKKNNEHDCNVTYDVRIRKCENEVQYKLPPTASQSAYCFKNYSKLYASAPDDSEVHLGSITVVPYLHFEELPTSNIRITNFIPHFTIRCNFSSQVEYFYTVNWYINENLFASLGPSNDTDTLEFHEDLLTNRSMGLGFNIACGVAVSVAVDGAKTNIIHSPSYFAGMKVLNSTVYIEKKGNVSTLKLKSTIPIGCRYDSFIGTRACKEEFRIFVNYDNFGCHEATIANNIDVGTFVNQRCSEGVQALTKDDVWDPEKIFEFEIITTDIDYDDLNVFNLRLEFSQNMGHKIWRHYVFPNVKVIVLDDASYKSKICYSHIDPHMRTADGYYFEQQKSGYFLLYRHKRNGVEVQEITTPCNQNRATCTCGVAVRAGKDVFMINRCGSISYLGFTSCGDGGILQVVRVHDYRYNIFTPIGTRVSITLHSSHSYSRTMNIDITMAPKDFENIDGLCGHFDDDKSNDLTHRDGTVSPISGGWGNFHYDFSDSWRLTGEENLFLSMSRNLTSWTQQNGFYCVCDNTDATRRSEALCSPTQYLDCPMTGSITEKKCSLTNRKKRNAGHNEDAEMQRLLGLMQPVEE